MTTQNHTTSPSPEKLLAIARHLTEDGDGIEQSLCDEVAAWLEKVAAQPQQPAGWIAISEMRPGNCETVLAFWTPSDGKVHSGCWATATFENGRWYNPEDDEDDYVEPSFWKPVDSPLDAPAHPSQQEDDARDAEIARLRSIIVAIDSLRGPFMSDDDIASVWKLVDAAMSDSAGEGGENG